MLLASGIYAQDNDLIVKTPQNLDDVLERKLSLDKKRLKNNQFTKHYMVAFLFKIFRVDYF